MTQAEQGLRLGVGLPSLGHGESEKAPTRVLGACSFFGLPLFTYSLLCLELGRDLCIYLFQICPGFATGFAAGPAQTPVASLFKH